MKKILLLLTLLSLLFITSCELFTEEPIKGDVYYINVGLDYKNNVLPYPYKNDYDDLKGTVNDAKELHAALGEVITKANRKGIGSKMIQEDTTIPSDVSNYPSKANIISKLEDLQSINDKDLTIFTYSGHGTEKGELVFSSMTGDHPYEFMNAEKLLSLMAAIPGKKLVILDSCYSGMFVEESPSSTNTILNNSIAKFFETYYSSDKYGKPDLFVLTASAHADSYETTFGTLPNSHGHGFFTYALLEALGWNHKSDTPPLVGIITAPPAATFGQITVDGLFQYIKKNQIIASSLNLFTKGPEYQHPMTTGGPLDLVLFNL